MTFKKQNHIHYAWLVLMGCCMLQGGSLGLINNCAGLFYAPVCKDLGFEMGAFTLYRMLASISSALTLPLVAKCIQKFDVRIVISTAAVVYGMCNVGMGTFSELWQWYLVGTVQGIASAFLLFLPAPVLLNNWFHKKSGTAIGISAAFSGLVGMMGSSGLGAAIPAFGWRACYIFTGLICIALILPFSVFVLRYSPERKGMQAYGAEAGSGEAADGKSREHRETPKGIRDFLRQPIFYVALLAYAAATASGYLNMFLTASGLAAGLTMTMAAMLTTLALCGNMTSKLVLGKASDTFGVVGTFLASMVISCAGHFLILAGTTGTLLAGSLFYGITMPVASVMMPLYCRRYWKGDTYGTAFSYITMAGTLLAAPFSTLFGRFYDITGSYHLTIVVSLAVMAVAALMVWIADAAGKKRDGNLAVKAQ